MKRILYIFFSAIVLFFAACKKNASDYKYNNVNSVSITTDTLDYAITQFEVLNINPTLTESKPNNDTYSYQWKAYVIGGTPIILSTNKELNDTIALPPGEYELEYRVTNNTTGLSAFELYSLTVNGAFYEGWLVSSNKSGKAMLSFIRSDDAIFLNPADAVNNTTYPGNALAAYAGVGTNISLALFFTDQGVFRFNANDFVQNGSTTDLFTDDKQFVNMPVYALGKYLIDQYIVADGGLYMGIGPAFYPEEVLKPYSDRITGDYNLFPGIFPSYILITYFYDNKYKRFMQASYLSRNLTVSSGSTTAVFNLSDVGKTMIAADKGVSSYYANAYYFVMEDDSGRYLMSLEGSQGRTPTLNQKIDNSPDILKATAFATSSVVRHMYYGADNKIYLYDILANSSRLVYSFPENYKIASINMLRATSKRIVVGVNNDSEGEVYYFDLDNLGSIVNDTFTKKFTGFGEIAHLSFREAG
ncbi:MAG: PKD-like family lipoprotein [Niabella sp.]